ASVARSIPCDSESRSSTTLGGEVGVGFSVSGIGLPFRKRRYLQGRDTYYTEVRMSARGGDRVTFAVRLTGVLAENGWSSAEAARRGKTSDANLSRWLKKGIVPDLATLDPIARRW